MPNLLVNLSKQLKKSKEKHQIRIARAKNNQKPKQMQSK
jgi:hypothetical protein